jgi:glycosyltransferase involved in cell wall biosynthesis
MKCRLRQVLSRCDRLIVTTGPLADAWRGLADDIRIVPNYLARDAWGDLKSRRGRGPRLRVGWAGALQHQGDLQLIHEVVTATADEVDWVFMGMCPAPIRRYIREFHGPARFEEYPSRLAELDLDLALAPLERNSFNEAKSNLRLLEYGALGWAVIASDIEPYRGAPVTLVPNKPQAWINMIREHVSDRDAAHASGDRLREWVRSSWMLEDHLDDWIEALTPAVANGAVRHKCTMDIATGP